MIPILYANVIDDPVHLARFEEIYQRYYKQMYYTANKVLQDSYEAEDALQDAFIGGSAAYWFYDDSASGAPGKIMAQQLDTTALFLADEQQPDIQAAGNPDAGVPLDLHLAHSLTTL